MSERPADGNWSDSPPFQLTAMHAAEPRPPLPIYQPTVKLADIYFHHPGAKPALLYNRDVDVHRYLAWPVLVLGGKTRGGTSIRAIVQRALNVQPLEGETEETSRASARATTLANRRKEGGGRPGTLAALGFRARTIGNDWTAAWQSFGVA